MIFLAPFANREPSWILGGVVFTVLPPAEMRPVRFEVIAFRYLVNIEGLPEASPGAVESSDCLRRSRQVHRGAQVQDGTVPHSDAVHTSSGSATKLIDDGLRKSAFAYGIRRLAYRTHNIREVF